MGMSLPKCLSTIVCFAVFITELYSEKCFSIPSYNKDKALQNAAFHIEKHTSLMGCAKLCWEHSLCSSISFSTEHLECRLNFGDSTMYPGLLIDIHNWIYLSINDITQHVLQITKENTCPLTTRHVQTTKRTVHCMEYNFGTIANVAPNKATAQINTFNNNNRFGSHKAADNVWTDTCNNACAHSYIGQTNPWWYVDLAIPHLIFHVVILNRRDCCASRLKNVEVDIGPNLSNMANFGKFSGPGQPGQRVTIAASLPKVGRYVKVWLNSRNAVLTLCEVGVYGVPSIS